jgi:SAM-dependent methyltransferase
MTATDDYLRSRAAEFGPSATVLDLGCGDGRFVEMLLDDGLNVIGVDMPDALPDIAARAAHRPTLDILSRISFFQNPEHIPYCDDSVDVVVSNTVFEHILTLGSTVAELARILKPGGRVYTVFPLGSAIVEQHCGLPGFHGIESRKLRLSYLKAAKVLGLYRGAPPQDMERYVYEQVFYRRENEIRQLFERYFARVESDCETYVILKAENLMRRGGFRRLLGRWLKANAAWLAKWVHVRHAAAYCLSEPRKS